MKLSRSILALGVLCASVAHAGAPQPPRKPAKLTAAQRTTALQRIEQELQAGYVFPEVRGKLVAQLEAARKAGRYDVDDALTFAERVTIDMREAARDHHLSLRVDPGRYAAALSPPKSDAGAEARERREAIRDHHGLAELRRLPGNLRYLKITGFEWATDETGAAYDDAMRFLKQGDAVIIDIRGNGGGSHAAVQYLVSHFLAPDTHELTFLHDNAADQVRALEHLPAGRLRDKPLYVLIDGRAASAAEAFAYDVQQFKLGELVGATTVGAANNNRFVPIAPGFVLSISFGRPVHAVSHTNWEGVGVAPTIAAPPAQALEVAQLHALDRLAKAKAASADDRAEYAWARLPLEAKLHPIALTAAQQAARAGTFGDLVITVREGALWMQHGARPEARLAPLTADGLFAVDGTDMLRVQFTAAGVELLWPGQPPWRFPRTR